MSPLVSVVVPCHNQGLRLDEAVDSVFAQTLQDFEILVVNDGSTDPATNRLLGNYRWPKTRVLTTERRGAGGARNLAVREAKGKYVCALDTEDRLERRYLESAAAALDLDPSLAFVSTWIRASGPEGEEESWAIHGAAVFRRETALAVGGYEEAGSEGGHWDLWLRLVQAGYQGTLVPALVFRDRPPATAAEPSTPRIGAFRRGPAGIPSVGDRRRALVEEALWNARRDIEDLRNSRSWRVTGPARAVHRWLVRLKGGP